MRRWGLAISLAYGLVVLGLGVPAFAMLLFPNSSVTLQRIAGDFLSPTPWVTAAVAAACQALLLFLSVDTSFRRLRPRRHLSGTIALTSLLATVLFCAGLASFIVGIYGDETLKNGVSPAEIVFSPLAWPALWLVWAVLFYVHVHGAPQPVARAIGWLLRGSVLELLIAVPAYVMVRQRGDCSAPVVTSFGIVTGLAIMLFAFGPGVLSLYKKRYDTYKSNIRPDA